jgi:hypothetical protein
VSAGRAAVRVVGLIVALLFALLVVVVATTGWQTLPVTQTSGRFGSFVPSWTRPCHRSNPARGTQYILACARVHGRVVYAEHHDSDGDGDRHLVVISGPRLVTIKVPLSSGIASIPGMGARVTATGTLSSERDHGLPVVRVGTLTSP